MKDTPATRGPAAAPLERPAATAHRLAAASLSPNTRRAYAGALHRLDAWLDGRELDDTTLALYLAELHDAGRAAASAGIAVAAAAFRARLAGQPPPSAAAARRRRSAPRTSRPCSPPAPGHAPAAAASSATRWPPGAAASTP